MYCFFTTPIIIQKTKFSAKVLPRFFKSEWSLSCKTFSGHLFCNDRSEIETKSSKFFCFKRNFWGGGAKRWGNFYKWKSSPI